MLCLLKYPFCVLPCKWQDIHHQCQRYESASPSWPSSLPEQHHCDDHHCQHHLNVNRQAQGSYVNQCGDSTAKWFKRDFSKTILVLELLGVLCLQMAPGIFSGFHQIKNSNSGFSLIRIGLCIADIFQTTANIVLIKCEKKFLECGMEYLLEEHQWNTESLDLASKWFLVYIT